MSRSGYTDDFDDILVLGRWRGQVESAIRGQRGQKLLRALRDALDAMPEKRLIADELVQDGEYCALGALGAKRGIDMEQIDPEEPEQVGEAFDIAPCLTFQTTSGVQVRRWGSVTARSNQAVRTGRRCRVASGGVGRIDWDLGRMGAPGMEAW